ncbi:MAG TPA: hypothetical protein ENI69_05700, partial [Rhodospirillales bacterium]|nr:hypothetical protein [Rhodospirillales bacterium]
MTRGTRRLIWIATGFILLSIATRIGLAIFSADSYSFLEWARFMGIGLIFDIAVLPYFLLPWALYDAVMPMFAKRPLLHKFESHWAALWGGLYLSFFVVIAVAEFTFWAEFGSRFDFIAVDYLVYTHEVIGNIRESYPVTLWMLAILAICLAISWISWPQGETGARSTWGLRWGRIAGLAIAIALGLVVVDQRLAETKSNAFVEQLSTNGIYALLYAYRHNQLDYDKYYPTLKTADLNSQIRKLVRQSNSTFINAEGIERKITAHSARKNVNIILISVESLSAEFLGQFGNTLGITPELDKLADRGLLFSNLYATGT